MRKLKLLFRVSRPVLWPIVPIIFLGGLWIGGSAFTLIPLIEFFLLSLPYCIFLYGINDVYDYETDKKNQRKGGAQGLKLQKKYHKLVLRAAGMSIIPLVLVSLLTLNAAHILALLLFLWVSYAYSAPPRLKSRPPLDSITCAVLYVLLPFAIGFSLGKPLTELPIQIYAITLGAIGMHAYSTLMDYHADKRAGDTTFSIRFGKRGTAAFACAMFLIAYLIGFSTLLLNVYILLGVLLFAYSIWQPTRTTTTVVSCIMYLSFVLVSLAIFSQQFIS